EETISASSTNSPSSKQSPSFEFVEQSQEEINLVFLESKSKEEINLVSLESEPQKELLRIKQKEIQNWYNYAEVFEDRVGQLIEDGYKNNTAQTELYDEIFLLISAILG
ncbi:27597_t:CDS:2, partial [Racocetra persica]